MKKPTQSVLLVCAILSMMTSTATFAAEKVNITLPQETARLKPGPGMDATANNCMICHSVDYITMQPPLTKDQWHGVVVKMQKVFGAPIPDSDIDTIISYLVTQNEKK